VPPFLQPRRPATNPVPIYLILALGQAFCFSLIFTVNMVYQVTVVGLTPFQLVIVGTVLEATCFLFEIPTGVLADVYSRRLSILIGIVLIGCGFLLEGSIPAFWAVVGAQVIWGIGYTFTSGATEAWITDEVGEDAVGPVFLRSTQMWLIGGLAGTFAAVALGVVKIQLPMVLAGVLLIALAAGLFIVMPERHMHPTPRAERSTFAHMRETTRDGFRLAMARPVVKSLIVVSLVVGLASEAFDRLNTASIIDRFEFPTVLGYTGPVVWFGVAGVIGTLLGLAATQVLDRLNPEALASGIPARLLASGAVLQVLAVIGFVLSGNLWVAFGMLWLRTMVGTVMWPVQAAWLNRNLDSSSRATVISMTGQANAIGQVGGGPILGWVGSAISIRAALLASAVVLSPTIALYGRLIAHRDAAPKAGEETLVENT
jgi:DHA3 family tetracycline resistance protein-like MFS transporter